METLALAPIGSDNDKLRAFVFSTGETRATLIKGEGNWRVYSARDVPFLSLDQKAVASDMASIHVFPTFRAAVRFIKETYFRAGA